MLNKLKNFFQLLRVKHWIKNGIVFIPAFYGGVMLQKSIFLRLILGFLVFSLCSSVIYIFNDMCDIKKDQMHPVKCRRPLASGAVTMTEGYLLLGICGFGALLSDWLLCGWQTCVWIPILYLVLNAFYSKWLKNRPVMDLVILVSGFALRMLYGSSITNVKISSWLYLTLIALSLFMAFGKRRNEKLTCGDTSRSVLQLYSENYLNSSMYMYLGVFLVFYALWSIDTGSLPGMIYTTPLVIVMIMRYTYMLERDEHGNPVDMILGDWVLLLLGALYAAFIFIQLYFPEVLRERI